MYILWRELDSNQYPFLESPNREQQRSCLPFHHLTICLWAGKDLNLSPYDFDSYALPLSHRPEGLRTSPVTESQELQ